MTEKRYCEDCIYCVGVTNQGSWQGVYVCGRKVADALGPFHLAHEVDGITDFTETCEYYQRALPGGAMTEERTCEYCKHMASLHIGGERVFPARFCAVDLKHNYELDGRAGSVREIRNLQHCCHLFERSDLWTMS